MCQSVSKSILLISGVQVNDAFTQGSIIIGMQITVWRRVTGGVTLSGITAHHQQLIGLIVAVCSSTESLTAPHKTGNKLIKIASVQLSWALINVCNVECRCDNHQEDEKCYD